MLQSKQKALIRRVILRHTKEIIDEINIGMDMIDHYDATGSLSKDMREHNPEVYEIVMLALNGYP